MGVQNVKSVISLDMCVIQTQVVVCVLHSLRDQIVSTASQILGGFSWLKGVSLATVIKLDQ